MKRFDEEMSQADFLKSEVDIFLAAYDCEANEDMTEAYIWIPCPTKECPQKCTTWKMTVEYHFGPTIAFENFETKKKLSASGMQKCEMLLEQMKECLK